MHPRRTGLGEGPRVQVASQVLGTGMSVPPRVVPNDHFASYLETSDEWIYDRTGIKERRWVEPGVTASALAEPAARDAIARAGLTPDDIDGIVFATVTPDAIFPSSACYLQKRLGISGGLAFDVNAVCSGFLYAFVSADALIARGLCRRVLVVGSDIYSYLIDKNDRSTCVLFGDGAGAVVLGAAHDFVPGIGHTTTGDGHTLSGVYGSLLGADGAYTDILCVPGAPRPGDLMHDARYLTMAGREVFKLAVRYLAEISGDLLKRHGFVSGDVDHFVSHQANRRILLAMAKQLDVPEEKVLMNVENYGNTSAASVPIMLAEAATDGRIKRGDLVLLSAFGGGVTWGASLVRW